MVPLEKVLANIDKDKLVQLGVELTSIPSPTGEEKAIAHYLDAKYREMGLRATLQEIEPERYNAIGVLKGDGTGPTLMFNGHLDTSYIGNEPGLPDLPGYKPTGFVKDGFIYGLGIYNMKSALACYLAAVDAVQKSGARLKGDVVIAGVAGEIEMGPVDAYQGRHYRGGGAGSVYLVRHGGAADFCVLGEPTDLRLVRAHMGFAYTRITVYGMPSHSAQAERTPSAIDKMLPVIQAIKEWAPKYKAEHRLDGTESGVNIAAIQGGLAYRGSRTPYYCHLYVDCRILPNEKPISVKFEFEKIMRQLAARDPELRYDVELYAGNAGAEIAEDEYLVGAVKRAHRTVTTSELEVVTARWYSDAVHLTRYGVPTLNYGPGGRTITGERFWDPTIGEHQSIERMYDCTKVYAGLIMDVCMQDREKVVKRP